MPDSVNPRVSVIIPAYNAEKFITKTLESVLAQTWSNLQVIVVNDGSTDQTSTIVRGFLGDRRVQLISQPNSGCSAAKNTGLQYVTGEWIQYLDADDILSPDKIEEQVTVLKNNPSHIAVCRTKVFSETIDDSAGRREVDTDFLFSTDNTFEFVLNLYGVSGRQGMIQPNAFLISRQLSDAIGPWDVSISPSPDEDGEYFCRAMLKATRIWFTEKGINYYRKQSNSASLSRQVSHLHASGALLSLQLKARHLLSVENSIRVKYVVARHYAEFIYSYASLYTNLCNEAQREIYKLGIKKIPVVGGRYFKSLANMIGFGNALSAKKLVRELPFKFPLTLLKRELSLFRVQTK